MQKIIQEVLNSSCSEDQLRKHLETISDRLKEASETSCFYEIPFLKLKYIFEYSENKLDQDEFLNVLCNIIEKMSQKKRSMGATLLNIIPMNNEYSLDDLVRLVSSIKSSKECINFPLSIMNLNLNKR